MCMYSNPKNKQTNKRIYFPCNVFCQHIAHLLRLILFLILIPNIIKLKLSFLHLPPVDPLQAGIVFPRLPLELLPHKGIAAERVVEPAARSLDVIMDDLVILEPCLGLAEHVHECTTPVEEDGLVGVVREREVEEDLVTALDDVLNVLILDHAVGCDPDNFFEVVHDNGGLALAVERGAYGLRDQVVLLFADIPVLIVGRDEVDKREQGAEDDLLVVRMPLERVKNFLDSA